MAITVSPGVIEEIKARTDLADLISSYGITVKRAGASSKACCPFHHEKTPSFNIQNDKGYYHCFGCGESGDCIKFVQKQEGLSFIEAVRKLAGACGVEIEEKEDPHAALRKRLLAMHAELAEFFRRCLAEAAVAQPARAYLAARGLDGEIAMRFQLGYAPVPSSALLKWAEKHKYKPEELSAAGILKQPRYAGDNWYNPFAGRLVFPIHDRTGRVVAFSCRTLETDKSKMRGGKYVNSPETVIFKKSNILYALDKAVSHFGKMPRREAIVCEGQIDVIRCHAYGFCTAVASQGTAFTEQHVKMLKRHAESAVLVFDGDQAGQKATLRTGAEFLAAEIPVRVAQLPAGEDPDSFLSKHGAEAFRACLAEAVSITAFQVKVLCEQETKPLQIDAIKRISSAVLDMLSKCPSAVLRASLLTEAARLLHLPQDALEEDLRKMKQALATAATRPAPEPTPPAPPSEPSQEAAAPENNPPSAVEMAFCAFLFEHEREARLASLLKDCAPGELFAHPFTRQFVRAWLEGAETEQDALAQLKGKLAAHEVPWLEKILLGSDRGALSEWSLEQMAEDFLRRLWILALQRLLAHMPQAGDPETARRRLSVSMLVRQFKGASWVTLVPRMKGATLAVPPGI